MVVPNEVEKGDQRVAETFTTDHSHCSDFWIWADAFVLTIDDSTFHPHGDNSIFRDYHDPDDDDACSADSGTAGI